MTRPEKKQKNKSKPKLLSFTPAIIKAVETYREQSGCESFSEATRDLIRIGLRSVSHTKLN